MNEPKTIVAGDTVKWTESLKDYPAASYTLTYTLYGQETYAVTAAASGNDYAVTIDTTASDNFIPGFYRIVGQVSKTGERYTVSTGTVQVLPNPSEVKAGAEFKSHARKTLALLESAIESHAVSPIEEITIAGRTLRRPSLADLVKLRAKYRWYVRDEENRERIANGLGGNNRILTRFVHNS